MQRKLLPRESPEIYDNQIHGAKGYGDAMYDGEPEEDIDARTHILHAIVMATPSVKADFLKKLNPPRVATKRDPISKIAPKSVPASEAVTQDRVPASEAATQDPVFKTIWYHGETSYSVDGPLNNPVCVTDSEHEVLQLFLGHAAEISLSRFQIEKKTPCSNAPRLLGLLVKNYDKRFALAVYRPGIKGKGGYRMHVRPVAQKPVERT